MLPCHLPRCPWITNIKGYGKRRAEVGGQRAEGGERRAEGDEHAGEESGHICDGCECKQRVHEEGAEPACEWRLWRNCATYAGTATATATFRSLGSILSFLALANVVRTMNLAPGSILHTPHYTPYSTQQLSNRPCICIPSSTFGRRVGMKLLAVPTARGGGLALTSTSSIRPTNTAVHRRLLSLPSASGTSRN